MAEIISLGFLDIQPLKQVFGELMTNELIVTNERIHHIQTRHPQDYAFFCEYCADAVTNPDLILKDSNSDNTVFYIKRLSETNLNVVVRLAVECDEKHNKNSVMTFYRIRNKNLTKLIAKNLVLYKSE